jgi:hypothetical protein
MEMENEIAQKITDNFREILLEIVDIFGIEQSVLIFLMSQGNLLKHLATLCQSSPEEWEIIMKDPVICLTSGFSMAFQECRKNLKLQYGKQYDELMRQSFENLLKNKEHKLYEFFKKTQTESDKKEEK